MIIKSRRRKRYRLFVNAFVITNIIGNNVFGSNRMHKFYLFFQGGIVFYSRSQISIVIIQYFQSKRKSQLPTRRTGVTTHSRIIDSHIGCNFRHSAVWPHIVGKILYHFSVESAHVEIVAESFCCCNHVGTISQFFAGRTIALNAENIAQESPFGHFLNPVKQFVRTLKTSGFLKIGVHPQSFYRIQIRLSGKTRHFNISKT